MISEIKWINENKSFDLKLGYIKNSNKRLINEYKGMTDLYKLLKNLRESFLKKKKSLAVLKPIIF